VRLGEQSVIDGVDVWRLARWTTVASMPVCPGLLRAIRKSPSDLVHMHMPNPAAALAFLVSGHQGKLVLTHHADTLGRKFLRKFSDGFVKTIMDRANAIIVTSQRYLDSSEELLPYREKCRVIPLGINPDGIAPKGIERSSTELLAIGRLVPYKGFDVLLEAMQYVEAHLTIIGTGPQKTELQTLIRRMDLQDKVSLLGRVDDLHSYFQNSSIFVMPSVTRAEAFGIVQLEAMAAGLPVVNTNIDSGVPEISLHGQTGLTVPPGDARMLALAINQLLQQPELRRRFGKMAQDTVLRQYTTDQMVKKTLAIYKEVL
jgi:glycosyltransferase involved in cell wall biosynthesis